MILIVLGLGFTLENFDILDLDIGSFWKFWPLILIVIGLSKILSRNERAAGLWVLGIGLWLQAVTLGLWGMDWGSSWPVLLILIGGIMVVLVILERLGLVAPEEGCEVTTGDGHEQS
jgi:hypothetical protein